MKLGSMKKTGTECLTAALAGLWAAALLGEALAAEPPVPVAKTAPLPQESAQTPAQTPTPTAAQAPAGDEMEILARVSAAINDIDTLEGRFIQQAPNGVLDQGRFYMRRPGRLRFEYEEPNPNLIVADGTWVILSNRDLDTVDRYPLRATPLKLLLKKNVDLTKDARVISVEQPPGRLVLTLRTAKDEDEAQGHLRLVFTEPDLTLRQWVITDAQGLQTTISLTDIRRGMKLDPALFVVRDKTPFNRRP